MLCIIQMLVFSTIILFRRSLLYKMYFYLRIFVIAFQSTATAQQQVAEPQNQVAETQQQQQQPHAQQMSQEPQVDEKQDETNRLKSLQALKEGIMDIQPPGR